MGAGLRLVVALFVVGVPGGPPPALARVMGGGPQSSDCFVTFDGVTATAGTRVQCTDGDPTCDGDGACDGGCEFQTRVCLNQCSTPPLNISRIKWKGPVLDLPHLPMRERACGRYTRLSHIAPHETKPNTDVRTFTCECGQEIAQTVPL